MGDRHGDRFARRGRALSPPRRNFPTARCGFPMARGGGPDLPRAETLPRRRPLDTALGRKDLPRARTLPTAKASRRGARAKGFARAGTLPAAKASRHGARAKGFAPRGFAFAPHADERRAAPDRRTAGKTPLRRGRTRDRARAKGFAPRRNVPLGEGLPTRRTGERICPTQERAPRRRPPDTAHERRDLCRGGSRSPHVPTNGGPPSTDGQPKNTPSAGSPPQRAAAAEFIHRKK